MSTKNISWGAGVGGKEGQYVGLTTLPLSGVDYIDNWEPQPPETLRACPDLYRICLPLPEKLFLQRGVLQSSLSYIWLSIVEHN